MENKLGNLVSFISKGIAPKYADESDQHVIRVLNQKCNRNFEINFENARYNNLDKKKVPEERILKENDILINSTGTGTAGRIAQIRKEQLNVPTTVDGHMIILRAKNIDPKFLGYSLKAKLRQLESYAEGSTGQTEINRERLLNETIINYPDNIEEQKKIVRQIECVDELIRLNKQINDNLAETKSAIFNELFDSKLANGLNGKLRDITDIKTGKRPKNKFNQRDSKAIYPIIGATKVMGFTTDYLYDESVVTVGRVGTHGIVQRYREPIWVSDNSFVFLSEHEDYLYELLSHRIKYSSLNVGSTQPLITQSDLKNVDIYIPTKQELSIFEKRATVLTNYQFELNRQQGILKSLQEGLLNKYF